MKVNARNACIKNVTSMVIVMERNTLVGMTQEMKVNVRNAATRIVTGIQIVFMSMDQVVCPLVHP